MEVSKNIVRILLERDKQGIFYDRGTKFQEITIRLNQSGKIDQVGIKNGNALAFKLLWTSQVIEIPAQTQAAGSVYFYGDEDAVINDIAHPNE